MLKHEKLKSTKTPQNLALTEILQNFGKTRMHSSRMRTARSLTVSPYLVVSYTPRSNHVRPPRATTHTLRSNHARPHPPCGQNVDTRF